jgi:hypothetical protein
MAAEICLAHELQAALQQSPAAQLRSLRQPMSCSGELPQLLLAAAAAFFSAANLRAPEQANQIVQSHGGCGPPAIHAADPAAGKSRLGGGRAQGARVAPAAAPHPRTTATTTALGRPGSPAARQQYGSAAHLSVASE